MVVPPPRRAIITSAARANMILVLRLERRNRFSMEDAFLLN